VALFGRNKSDDEQPDADTGAVAFTSHPEKATKWFAHARAMSETTNFETALVYYASGIKFDPANEQALEEMLQTGIRHVQSGGKRLSNKTVKAVDGDAPTDTMAVAILLWLSDIQNPTAGIKAMEAIRAADQKTTGQFFAPHVLGIVSRGKKPTKQQYVTLKDLCKDLESWDNALIAGQAAMQLDPTDGGLEHEIKDLSAQRAMSQGGYEEAAGREGGFRDFVKDMGKQRELEEEESLAGAGGGSERVKERARARFKEAPDVAENINRYGTILRREGTEASLKLAEQVFLKGFKSTNEYRFRMAAGDIRMQRFRDRIKNLKIDADATADPERIQSLEAQLLEFESKEFTERAERYPTDRTIRFHLGKIAFRTGDIETAMGCFQKSKDEPRLRAASGHLLGQCFASEGWLAEAVAEYREVLTKIDATEAEREMQVRYDLMLALLELARRDASRDHAQDALDICSGIARQDITYRDIRNRRREIDELLRSLS
jgi:tetratricopeptide (TPR) repeat protein